MNVEELTDKFRELLNYAPFEKIDVQPNLFEIAGFRHYEEVISNCYSFFFQTDNPHGLSSLFLDALTDLIEKKGIEAPSFTGGRCVCERERVTKQRKFIDLFLYDELIDDEKNETYRNAIIIENKVNAGLYNDLGHYLSDVTVDGDGRKVGVVLSLNRMELTEKQKTQYINITHGELIAGIQQKLGVYLLTATEKYLILLKEFLANLSYLSTPTRMDESVQFYYQNAAKIKELVSLHKSVESQIVSGVKKEVENLEFYFPRGSSTAIAMRHRMYPELVSYILIGNLIGHQSYVIETWVSGSRIASWQMLSDTALTQLSMDNEERISVKKPGSGKKWGLTARAEINLPKEYASVEKAPLLIHEYIKYHWIPVLEKLNALLINVKV